MKLPSYSHYKPSGIEWLGDVPDHWNVICLRRIATRYAGGTPDRGNEAYWEDGTIPWINSGAVNQALIQEPSAFITEEAYANSSAKWVPKGALVIALAGQGRTKGTVAQTGIAITCNQSMAAICPNDTTDPRFLYWLLVSQYHEIRNMAGGEARDGLNLEILGAIPCLKLPSAEQRTIATFLDRETAKLDMLVGKKRELIEKLKEKRTALISRSVTRGLSATAANAAGLDPQPKLKPSGIEWLGDIPQHWEVGPIKSFAKAGGRTFTDGDWVELPFITDEGIRLIQTGNVGIGNYKEQGFRYISDESFNELRCTEVMPNDILICRLDGPVGRACLAPNLGVRMITSVDNTIVKVHGDVSPQFAVFLLSSAAWLAWIDAQCRVGGGFRMRISRTMLGNIRIPIPPPSEQTAIAAYLDRETAKIDRMIVKVEAAVTKLQEYRTALITAAVTGKIDVRGTASP